MSKLIALYPHLLFLTVLLHFQSIFYFKLLFEFKMLPSSIRYRMLKLKRNRYRHYFIPTALWLLNLRDVRMLWCYLFCFCVLYDVYKCYVAPIIALWAYNKFEP